VGNEAGSKDSQARQMNLNEEEIITASAVGLNPGGITLTENGSSNAPM